MSRFPSAALGRTIPQRFHEQAECHADRPAVRHAGVTLDYRALASRVHATAAAIHAATGPAPRAVALLLPQGIDLVVAILATLEAGHWYVPLDVTASDAELESLLARAETALSIVDATTDALGTRTPRLRVDRVATATTAPLPLPGDPDALAYVYFTSGTSGPPKGVMDTHRNVLHNVMRYTEALEWGPEDRLSLWQAPPFSGAVSNVFGALLNGALLLPYDVARDGAGEPLARWILAEGPTSIHSVPSLFRGVCLPGTRFPSVRVVRLEGDSGAPRDADRFREHFTPGAVLAHGLGATETGLSCQYRLLHGEPSPADALPIGYPVTGMEVVVLDDDGAPVAPGVTGEIVVRSRYLSPGYWRDPERTAAAFRPDPTDPTRRQYRTGDLGRVGPDGALRHLGRRDARARVRGLWVDVPAVESALAAVPGVAEAAVALASGPDGEPALTAFVVPTRDGAPSMTTLRRVLAGTLPPHAIPPRGVALAALPLGPNRKLDRRALGALTGTPLEEGAGQDPPRDAMEATLADIWRLVLGLDRVGIHDRFVELGGDSLNAAEVAIAVEQRLGVTLTHSALAEAPTVAALAARLRASGADAAPHARIPLRVAGSRPPLFAVHELESDAFLFSPLARRLGPDQPVHGLRLPAGEPVGKLPATLEALAARYLDEVTEVAPHGPYHLAGFCFGGTVALEMARLLGERGERVATLALLNVTAYDLMALVSPEARRRFRGRLGERVRYLARKPDALGWLGRRLRASAGDALAAAALSLGLTPARPADPAAPWRVRAALRRAFRRHVARPHHGDLTLFLAEETLPLYTDDPHRAWRGAATGRVTIHHLPHDGYAMLTEPDVAVVAAALRGAMDASD